MSKSAVTGGFGGLSIKWRKAIVLLVSVALGGAILSAPQASANNIASLSSTSTIKGVRPSALGPEYLNLSSLGSQPPGTTTLTSLQASDTSTVTTFVPVDSGASISKVVWYPSPTTVTAPISTFATDTAYNGTAALTGGGFFVVQVTASDTVTKSYYQISVAVLAATPDATLKATSKVKVQTVTSLGTPNASLGTVTPGAVALTSAQAADTSNAGSYITSFTATDAGATVNKIVKYASGASTSNFTTDIAYNGTAAVVTGDFFVIKVTSSDLSTVQYYQIVATVSAPLSSDATLTSLSLVKGQQVSNLGTPNATLASVVAGTVTLSAVQGGDTSNAGSYVTAFMPTDPGASVTRIVKYASGASTSGFATDSVYNGTASISNGDFFVIAVTAADASVLDYKITVAVSAVPLTVPNLAGLSTSAAETAIRNAGFILGTENPVNNAGGATASNFGSTTGTQSPTAGSLASAGTLVSFSYYSYTAPAPVTYTVRYYCDFTQGTISRVLLQQVSAGGAGTTVTAIGNNGWVFTSWSDGRHSASRAESSVNGNIKFIANFSPVVPDLSGLSKAAAEKAITDAGLLVGQESPVANIDGATAANNGTVTGTQFPAARSVSISQTPVNFSYYSYKAPTVPAPTIDSLSYMSMYPKDFSISTHLTGGDGLYIYGSGFASGAIVKVGGVAATDVVVISSSEVHAKTPPSKPGDQEVTVTNPDGQVATGPTLYYAPHTLVADRAAVSVTIGATATISISSDDAPLKFVATPNIVSSNDHTKQQVSVLPSFAFTAKVAGVSLGTSIVTVSIPGYTDATFTVKVSPAVPDLSGLNKFDAEAVIVAAGYTVGTETVVPNYPAITMAGAVAPASAPGHTTGTQSPTAGTALELGGAIDFSYYAFRNPAPLVSSFSVKVGPPAGGTQIHVSGHGLDIKEMSFGNIQVTQLHGVDDSNNYIGSPSGTPGAVDITVVNQDGQLWTGKAYFTYVVPTVPDLSKMAKAAAEKAITDAGFKVGTETSLENSFGATAKNDGLASGTQSPKAGSTPNAGSTVNFSYYTYTKAPAPVVTSVSQPTKGLSQYSISGDGFSDDATLKIGSYTATSFIIPNHSLMIVSLNDSALAMIASNPQDVTVMNPDGQVGIGLGIFTFGTGAAVVPDLKGLTITAAKDAITKAGFTVGTATPVTNFEHAEVTPQNNQLLTGTQSPVAGSAVEPNTKIEFSYNSYLTRIFFGGEGGSVPGGHSDYEQVSDVPTALIPNKFVYPGHIFAGWRFAGKILQDGAIFSFDSSYHGSDLFAVWTPIQYHITFDANGASGEGPVAISGNVDNGVALPGVGTMKRTGYIFGGWSRTGAAPAVDSTSFTTSANVTLLAIWNAAPIISGTNSQTTTKKTKTSSGTTVKKSATTKTVPNLSSMSRADAEAAITKAGFKVGTETSVGNSSGATADNDGKVTGAQTPVASSNATAGSSIDFSYYVYTAPASSVVVTNIKGYGTSSYMVGGKRFVDGATITIAKNIHPTILVVSDNSISFQLTTDQLSKIPTGAQDVTVINSDGSSGTGSGVFTWGTGITSFGLPSNIYVYGKIVPPVV